MKHLLFATGIICLISSSINAFAKDIKEFRHDNCVINVVTDMPSLMITGVMPEVNDLLSEKGYEVIQMGRLWEKEDVLINELEVRKELLAPGSLLGVYNTFLGKPRQKCFYAYGAKKPYYCATALKIYQIDESGDSSLLARFDSSTIAPAFKSESEAVSKIVKLAKKSIPNCKLK